jgi:hypothetical protein
MERCDVAALETKKEAWRMAAAGCCSASQGGLPPRHQHPYWGFPD